MKEHKKFKGLEVWTNCELLSLREYLPSVKEFAQGL